MSTKLRDVVVEIRATDKLSKVFRSITNKAQILRQKLTSITSSATAVTAGIVGIGGALAAGKFAQAINQTADRLDTLAKQSRKLGLSANDLDAYRFAAERSGVETRKFDIGMQRLSRRMADAADGRNKQVAGLFDDLGISLQDGEGNVRSLAEILPELAAGFKGIGDQSEKIQSAFKLFDSEGVDIMKMFEGGPEAMAALVSEAEALRGPLNDLMTGNAEAFKDRISNLEMAFKGIGNTLATEVMPKLDPLLKGITDFLALNRERIGASIGEMVGSIAENLKKIDGEKLLGWFDAILNAIGQINFSGIIDGIGTMVAAFADAWNGYIWPILKKMLEALEKAAHLMGLTKKAQAEKKALEEFGGQAGLESQARSSLGLREKSDSFLGSKFQNARGAATGEKEKIASEMERILAERVAELTGATERQTAQQDEGIKLDAAPFLASLEKLKPAAVVDEARNATAAPNQGSAASTQSPSPAVPTEVGIKGGTVNIGTPVQVGGQVAVGGDVAVTNPVQIGGGTINAHLLDPVPAIADVRGGVDIRIKVDGPGKVASAVPSGHVNSVSTGGSAAGNPDGSG